MRHLIVTARDFDFDEPGAGSRLQVQMWFSDTRYGSISATGANCTAVLKTVQTRFLPNMEA